MAEIRYPYIQFIGAAGTVTGSKTVITAGPKLEDRIMIDCGLFQGPKRFRLRNWTTIPVDPVSVGAVLMTHAHLDHCGYLPRLVSTGFSGPVYCTAATADLIRIILLDSAHIQEEEAKYANKKGFSKHRPALPLYTREDALAALKLLRIISRREPVRIGENFQATFYDAGHILGATSIRVDINTSPGKSIVLSGDLGRYGVPILPDPDNPPCPDWVMIESTYGGRYHPDTDPAGELAEIINQSIERGGTLVIPAFAIGRTQLVLFTIRQLQDEGAIPKIPIFIDSPMAIEATKTVDRHDENLDIESLYLKKTGVHPIHPHKLRVYRSVEESKSLNQVRENAIIISASGMATGGRILHHLKLRLPHRKHTILFIGYQAYGTRGRTLLEGQDRVKIHGEYIPVKAKIKSISGFSAHADQDELIAWLKKFDGTPRGLILNHGEEETLGAQKEKLGPIFKIPVHIAEFEEKFNLD